MTQVKQEPNTTASNETESEQQQKNTPSTVKKIEKRRRPNGRQREINNSFKQLISKLPAHRLHELNHRMVNIDDMYSYMSMTQEYFLLGQKQEAMERQKQQTTDQATQPSSESTQIEADQGETPSDGQQQFSE